MMAFVKNAIKQFDIYVITNYNYLKTCSEITTNVYLNNIDT